MKEFEDLVEACTFLLKNFPEAEQVRQYLNNRISKKAQEKFCFGYFPTEENFSTLTSMVSSNKLVKLKLAYEKNVNEFSDNSWDYIDDDDFENSGAYKADKIFKQKSSNVKTVKKTIVPTLKDHNMVLPYRDVYGNTIALVGRTIIDNHHDLGISKYKNTSFDKSHHLFGLYEAKSSIIKNDCVYIVEGQFDCIKAHDKWQSNVVALGSSSMSLYQLSILCRYTKNIFLLLDNDVAGDKGRIQIMKKFSNYADFTNSYVPKQFKDLDEYLGSLSDGEEPSFSIKFPKY